MAWENWCAIFLGKSKPILTMKDRDPTEHEILLLRCFLNVICQPSAAFHTKSTAVGEVFAGFFMHITSEYTLSVDKVWIYFTMSFSHIHPLSRMGKIAAGLLSAPANLKTLFCSQPSLCPFWSLRVVRYILSIRLSCLGIIIKEHKRHTAGSLLLLCWSSQSHVQLCPSPLAKKTHGEVLDSSCCHFKLSLLLCLLLQKVTPWSRHWK